MTLPPTSIGERGHRECGGAHARPCNDTPRERKRGLASHPRPGAAARESPPDGLDMRFSVNIALCLILVLIHFNAGAESATRHMIAKRNYSDQSVKGYLAERTCWWNEVCKEEFHSKFRCRCPRWAYCRAPGRYYDAHCSMTRTGYIWTQPEIPVGLDAAADI